MKYFRRVLRMLYHIIYLKPKAFVKLLMNPNYYSVKNTYYPEKSNKNNSLNIFIYQCRQILKYSSIDEFVFMYGIDVQKNPEEYVNYRDFMVHRESLNFPSLTNNICLISDKFYFGMYADSIGIDTGKNICLTLEGMCYVIKEKKKIPISSFLHSLTSGKWFCKLIDGGCGEGIFVLECVDGVLSYNKKEISIEELVCRIGKNSYVFQEAISQHPEMDRLYGKSINTIRLVTVRDPKTSEIITLPSVLRIGANGNFVDNWSQGGLAIGFDQNTGQLHDEAFYKPCFGFRVNKHPDTGVYFNSFEIPFIKEAIEQAKFFHSMLFNIHSIGWDIAIGKDGPIFVEANSRWEISLHQACHGSLKREFERYFL